MDHVKRTAWGFSRLFLALFLAAGTLEWLAAWCFLGLFLVGQTAMAIIAGRPRSATPPVKSDPQRRKLNVRLLASLAIAIVAGLNYRFGWAPHLSLELQLAAWGLGIAAVLVNLWAMSTNKFFHGVERAGQDGHRLLTGGPYGVVRHPSAAAVLLSNLSKPLMLGSLWALLPALVVLAHVARETIREDRLLRAKLPGYRQYSESVRHRVVPGIW